MAGNNTTNTQTPTVEATEQAKKKQSRNLVREFVTPFIETKLAADTGAEFYNRAKATKGEILGDFLAYWKSRDEWNNLNKEEKIILESLEKALFLKEIVRIGAGMESKRDTLGKLLDREFDISENQKKSINSEIQLLSLGELTRYLSYSMKRKELISHIFPKKGTEPLEYKIGKQFETLFENNKVALNEDQKQAIFHLLVSPYADESHIDAILPLFSKLEEKQLIIKYFLPTITVGELQEMGILSKSQVSVYIRKCVEEQLIGKDFIIDDDLVDSVDPMDIILPTSLMPEEDLDKLLAGKGKREIIKQIEKENKERLEEFETGNILGLAPDEDGKLLPSFQKELFALKIPGAELFGVEKETYIRGKVKQPDGTFHTFHFAITGIEDDPVKNRSDKGNGKQVAVKNILTSNGSSINKNWRNKEPEFYSYSDIHALLKKSLQWKWAPEITTQKTLTNQIDNGEITEKILREDIHSLHELNDALDTIDSKGKKYPIAQNKTSIQVGKPGDTDFCIFQVKTINETANPPTIAISDSNGLSDQILTYQEFFDNFESKKEVTRLPNLETPEDFLRAIQEHSPKGKDFAKIIFNKDRGIFMPEDRKYDKNFPGILQFCGEKDTITLHEDASGLASWSEGEWDEKEKKYKSGAKGYKAGWNALYAQFLTLRAIPKIPDVPLTAPEQKDAHMHEHHGFFKHYMGNPSLHDMFNAAKGIVDFIKHKLEHGSKVHSATFQLALGKKLGFNDAMMRELRNQVHGSTRELMEKMVKELTTLPAGERQTEVKHILENKGSHDYEIQAAILSMLKKHGTLYPGSLKPLEGSFAYFERLSGTKYGPNNPHVQRALREAWGNLFREEFLIQNYLQFIGGKAWWYQVDWNLWTEVNRSWLEGISSEKKAGEERAAPLPTLDGQLGWVYNKFAWGEYSNGIGAMKEVWKRWGPPHKMHEPAIYLALSNISTRLHGSQLDALRGEFYGGGHPYPALTALFTPGKLAIFQQTVKILSEGDSGMKKAYKKIEDARSEDVGKTVEAIRNFWSVYGPELHKKLLISQDPEILFRAEHDTDPETREVLSSYIENYKADTENMGKFNDDELGEWVYDYGHSGFTWSTDAYLKRTKVDRWPGTLWDDDGTKKIWKGYLESLDAIKWVSLPGDDEKEKREFRYQRFKEHHKSFYKNIFDRSGADWADEDKNGIKKIAKQTYMIDLMKRWFRIPPWKDKDKLEKPEYDHIAREDFDTYMSGEKKTAQDEKETVATSISELLAK